MDFVAHRIAHFRHEHRIVGDDCTAVGAVGHQNDAFTRPRDDLHEVFPTSVGSSMSDTHLARELIRPNGVAETVLRIRPVGIAICPARVRLRRMHQFDGLQLQHTATGRSACKAV